jgi:hypothetical protein
MNRVCLTKDGKLIEMQSGGDDREDLMETRLNTLKQNALNAGYKEDEIEVKWATDEEWAAIQEANKPDLSAQENYKSMIRRRARRLAAGSIDEKYQAILLLKKIGE